MDWIDEMIDELEMVQDCRDTFQSLVWNQNGDCKYNLPRGMEGQLLQMLSSPINKADMVETLKEIDQFKITYIDPMTLNQTQRAKYISKFCL